MRVLLDTHILLWALIEPWRLPAAAQSMIGDPANEILFSAVSIWEVAIKKRLGRADPLPPPGELLAAAIETAFTELPVRASVAEHVVHLPLYHRDPFDHLLVAQAVTEPALLLTADKALPPYSELVRLIG